MLLVLINVLIVVVIGGLGSVRGALLGALVIGEIESLGRDVLSNLASFVLFGALAVVLIVRFVRTGGGMMLKMMGGAPEDDDSGAGAHSQAHHH